MRKIMLFFGLVLITGLMSCSPRFSFIKADYDGQRRPTQVGYDSSGHGHSNDRYRGYDSKGFGHSRYGYERYGYRGYRSRY